MPCNPGSFRSSSSASSHANSTLPLPGSVHKLSSHSLAMHKARRNSSTSSFTSVSGSSSPPSGPRAEFLRNPGDDEELASPGVSVQVYEPFVAFRSDIEPAQRRSSFLAEGMLKEHFAYDRLGRDKDGYERYALRMVESYGFKWNRFLHRLAESGVPRSDQLEYYDMESDCTTTDDDEHENDVFEGEPLNL